MNIAATSNSGMAFCLNVGFIPKNSMVGTIVMAAKVKRQNISN